MKAPKPAPSNHRRIVLTHETGTGVKVLLEVSWPRTVDWVDVRLAIQEAARLTLLEHAAAD